MSLRFLFFGLLFLWCFGVACVLLFVFVWFFLVLCGFTVFLGLVVWSVFAIACICSVSFWMDLWCFCGLWWFLVAVVSMGGVGCWRFFVCFSFFWGAVRCRVIGVTLWLLC